MNTGEKYDLRCHLLRVINHLRNKLNHVGSIYNYSACHLLIKLENINREKFMNTIASIYKLLKNSY